MEPGGPELSEQFHNSTSFYLYRNSRAYPLIFCQTKSHTDILFNQSEASTSQLVSSLSAYESKQSLTACLLTFCNQLGA